MYILALETPAQLAKPLHEKASDQNKPSAESRVLGNQLSQTKPYQNLVVARTFLDFRAARLTLLISRKPDSTVV